jgi:hypothetical protein
VAPLSAAEGEDGVVVVAAADEAWKCVRKEDLGDALVEDDELESERFVAWRGCEVTLGFVLLIGAEQVRLRGNNEGDFCGCLFCCSGDCCSDVDAIDGLVSFEGIDSSTLSVARVDWLGFSDIFNSTVSLSVKQEVHGVVENYEKVVSFVVFQSPKPNDFFFAFQSTKVCSFSQNL